MKLHFCYVFVIVGIACTNVGSWPCEATGESFTRPDGVGTLSFNVSKELPDAGIVKTLSIFNYNGNEVARVRYTGTTVVSMNALPGFEVTANSAGQVVLETQPPQAAKKGTYWVDLFENDKCMCLYILGVPTTPSISKNRDPSVGESVILTCSSRSTTTPSNHSLILVYNWTVDSLDDPISSRYTYSASRHTLTLSSVVKDDANKQFTCTSTENVPVGYTSSRSNVTLISVFYGPENMAFSPSNTSYELEENTELPQITCSAACNPVCSFQWIKQTTGQQISNNNALQLGSLETSEAGTYRCIATRSGSVTSSQDLTVNVIYGPSSVVLSPSVAMVRQDEGTTLSPRTCSAQCWLCEYHWSGPVGYSSQGPVLNLGTLDRFEHGEYTCTATNKKHSRPAKTANITVEVRYGPDSVVLSPATTTYTVDELDYLGNIICSADCFPSCSFSWTKKGQLATVSNTATLQLGIVRKGYMGNYTCTAQNIEISPSKSATAEIQLYVKYGPYPESTTLSPAQTAYTVNENDVLSAIKCHADCYPDCSYTWTKNGDGLTSVVSSSAVLDLKTMNRTDAATYICSAVNEYKRVNNSTQKEVQVNVNYGPDRACDNVSSVHTFTEGDSTVSIKCFSECYPGCSYTWFNGSGLLSNSEILSLGSVRRYQAGNYTFTVSNTAQTYSKSAQKIFTVVVKYAPAVSIAFTNMNVSEGTSLTLFCRGEGVPPTYTYTELTQTVGGVQVPNPNTALSGTVAYSSIQFWKLQLQDTGNFTCRMNNGILDLNGTLDQSATVQLLVEVQPKILEDDIKYVGVQSNPITVQVPFYCYPAVQSVTFVRYDGTVIQNSTKYRTSYMPGKVNDMFYGKEVTLNGYIAVLTINDLEEEDFVNYTLTVHSSRGTTSELIFIVPESIPSIPKSFFLSSTGLLFVWEKGFNGGHLQTFIIQVSAEGKEEWQNLSSIHENEASHQINSTFYNVEIRDLDPGTYRARIITANSLGETVPLYLNTTFTVMSYERATEHPSKVGQTAGAVGGSVSAIVVIAVVVGVVVWRRRVVNNVLGTKQETHKRQKQVSENSYYNLQSLQEGQSTYCDLMKTDTSERSNYSDLKLYERSTDVSAYGKLAGADDRDRNRTYASLCPETREPSAKEGHDKTYVNLVVKK